MNEQLSRMMQLWDEAKLTPAQEELLTKFLGDGWAGRRVSFTQPRELHKEFWIVPDLNVICRPDVVVEGA